MKLYESVPLASEWYRLAGVNMYELIIPVWIVAGDCIPDPIKIDEKFKTPDGVSTREHLNNLFGQRAMEIIETLLTK